MLDRRRAVLAVASAPKLAMHAPFVPRAPVIGRLRCVIAGVVAATVCGCSFFSPYRIEIQQGNYISQESMSQVRPGMTKDQVRGILGTPLINDVFHVDRWDYVYRRSAANSSAVESRRATLHFDGDILKRVESDLMPSGQLRTGASEQRR